MAISQLYLVRGTAVALILAAFVVLYSGYTNRACHQEGLKALTAQTGFGAFGARDDDISSAQERYNYFFERCRHAHGF